MKMVMLQSAIVMSEYPGFDLDVKSYMIVNKQDKQIELTTGSELLNKLNSLLFLADDEKANNYLHDDSEFKEMNKNLKLTARQLQAEDSLIDMQVASKIEEPEFVGIQKMDSTIHDKYISLPVAASPATLSLFFHKGPSPYTDPEFEIRGVCQNFYAQPQFNHRKVQPSRFDLLVESCQGKTKFDLTTHQVAIIPYNIVAEKYTTPHNIHNPRFNNDRKNFNTDAENIWYKKNKNKETQLTIPMRIYCPATQRTGQKMLCLDIQVLILLSYLL